MNKKSIITALLALVVVMGFIVVTGQAKTYKVITNPEAMACVYVNPGDLKVNEVVMTDTATTLHFTMQYPKDQCFRFVKESFLVDEDGIRYPLRSADGIAIDTLVKSPESGMTDFIMNFEPMPEHVKMFDFINGDVMQAYQILGIHDKEMTPKTPTIQELYANNAYALPEDWLKTDFVTFRGRIKDYDAKQLGFTSMQGTLNDVMVKEEGMSIVNIKPDGTFEKRFKLSYPMKLSFYITDDNSHLGHYRIPFFARPGDTIDITIRHNEHGQYDCFYNSGSSHEVERWLKSNLRTQELGLRLSGFKGKFSEARLIAEQVWQDMLTRIDIISRRMHFSPMEMHLALGEMQSIYALAYMDYALHYEQNLKSLQEFQGGSMAEIVTDSTELRALGDMKNYKALQHIDFDNPLLMVHYGHTFTINYLQYALPIRKAKQESMKGENTLEIHNATMRELTGSKHNNLTVQLYVLQYIMEYLNSWQQTGDTSIFPLCLSSLTHPYVRQKAEQFYQEQTAQTDLATPLPNGSGIEIIRDIISKYPGRYLMIDFWGMGCGPCRAAIQISKELRSKIAKRDDVKLVYIAGEKTTKGNDAYKKYVAEWLAEEETVCITNQDFTRLQELFQFSSIPHYETITPDGRRVCESFQIHGYQNFDIELERLKEKLK